MKFLSKNLATVFVITLSIMLLAIPFEQDAFAGSGTGAATQNMRVNPLTNLVDDGTEDIDKTVSDVRFPPGNHNVHRYIEKVEVFLQFQALEGGTCENPVTGLNARADQMSVTLTSPAGTSVVLIANNTYTGITGISNPGATYATGNADAVRLNLVDVLPNESIPPLVGSTNNNLPDDSQSYRPVEPLSAFINETPLGEWVLTYGDNDSGAPLCITGYYALDLTTSSTIVAPPPPTGTPVVYTFTNSTESFVDATRTTPGSDTRVFTLSGIPVSIVALQVTVEFQAVDGQSCVLDPTDPTTNPGPGKGHVYADEISMYITGPAPFNTRVDLIYDSNFSPQPPTYFVQTDDDVDTRDAIPPVARVTFDDNASEKVGSDRGVPVSGTFRPADEVDNRNNGPDPVPNRLSEFNGQDPNGVWTLTFADYGRGAGLCFKEVVLEINRITTIDPTNPITKKSGGGDSKHLTKPTFGLSHATFIPLVDDSFTFNEKSFDITNNFWTPFDIQTINIGETNSFSAKVYAQNNLFVQEFLFGIPQVGDAHNAELGIEVWYERDGTIQKVEVVQETDIIDVESLLVIYEESYCQPGDYTQRCDTTHLSMKFLEPLQHDVMAIKAIDYQRRSHITYLNEGFDVSGVSLNPMITMMVLGTEKYEGLVKVTQSAKYSDLWITDDGRTFEANQYGSFRFITQPFERTMDPGDPKTRLHSEFVIKLEYESQRANVIIIQLCPHCNDESYGNIHDIFAYEFPEQYTSKYDNPKIQELLLSESLRAQKLLDE